MLAQPSKYEQGSPEWLTDRIPYVTASSISDVMAKGSGATRQNYMVKKMCELLSGKPTVGYKSKYMKDGNEKEPVVRQLYEAITGNTVIQVPFHFIEEEKLGASLDGEIEEEPDGCIEIKHVIPAEQIRLLTTGKIKSEYIKQMQTQMYVREKKWCDFVQASLGDEENGELPDEYKVKIIRVYRDETMILEIRKEVKLFHRDLQALMEKLRGPLGEKD